jgi:hypothetical protein
VNKYIVTSPLGHASVEADHYSVSSGGTALFYRNLPRKHNEPPFTPELITSVSPPFIITKEGDGDWYENKGFPPGTFTNFERKLSPEEEEKIRADLNSALRHPVRQRLVYGKDWYLSPVTVPATAASKITDPASFLAKVIEEQRLATLRLEKITQQADLIRAQQVIQERAQGAESPPEPETPVTVKVTIRYTGKDGNKYLKQVNVPVANDGYFIDVTDVPGGSHLRPGG